jgi:hypothetical protein
MNRRLVLSIRKAKDAGISRHDIKDHHAVPESANRTLHDVLKSAQTQITLQIIKVLSGRQFNRYVDILGRARSSGPLVFEEERNNGSTEERNSLAQTS